MESKKLNFSQPISQEELLNLKEDLIKSLKTEDYFTIKK